ncbi:MAG: hypothetical protein LBK06_02630 [Planctomycetaceae bacterium]|nr:hypothetical protein [Planctomycetaceae bacterium]
MISFFVNSYAKAVLTFVKLNTAAQQREEIVQGRSLLPYRLRYTFSFSSCSASSFLHCLIEIAVIT